MELHGQAWFFVPSGDIRDMRSSAAAKGTFLGLIGVVKGSGDMYRPIMALTTRPTIVSEQSAAAHNVSSPVLDRPGCSICGR
ncbi:MAG: hypothetical protein INR71_11125 [Terriglobus roseus]|nr:hypothetical protein [Terriglobus roseus]